MQKKLLTLCMLHTDTQILLGMKKRGFGAGRWNGFGGKLMEGETLEAAAIRELHEEIGVTPVNMTEKGILNFEFENDPKGLEVHVYGITEWKGEPIESEEMKPEWFPFDKIPYEQMWSDDIYWLPIFLKGKKFKGTFLFDKPSTAEYSAKILRQELQEVELLDLAPVA